MTSALDLAIAGVALVIGVAMIWLARPNAQGEHPRFLRRGLVQMVYPVVAMLFLVIGIAQLILAIS
jgi:hypothetical protein